MRLTTLVLLLTAITVTALAAAQYSIVSINLSGLSSMGETVANRIRQRCPVRLVQPEWIVSESDGLEGMDKWIFTEIKARFCMITFSWLVGVSLATWYYARKRKARNFTTRMT